MINAQGGEEIERQFLEIKSPLQDVGLFRLSGAFPTFSGDGKKVAFVDNEFKSVWVADDEGLRIVYEVRSGVYQGLNTLIKRCDYVSIVTNSNYSIIHM